MPPPSPGGGGCVPAGARAVEPHAPPNGASEPIWSRPAGRTTATRARFSGRRPSSSGCGHLWAIINAGQRDEMGPSGAKSGPQLRRRRPIDAPLPPPPKAGRSGFSGPSRACSPVLSLSWPGLALELASAPLGGRFTRFHPSAERAEPARPQPNPKGARPPAKAAGPMKARWRAAQVQRSAALAA
jgi:hypothetical protein